MARNKYFCQDRRAMRIADRYKLVPEYKKARRFGFTPLQSLEDWDMLLPGESKRFEE